MTGDELLLEAVDRAATTIRDRWRDPMRDLGDAMSESALRFGDFYLGWIHWGPSAAELRTRAIVREHRRRRHK